MKISGNERVLVCPLGWGLGHTSRSVQLINQLIQKGCTVLVAGDPYSIAFLRSRFPELSYIPFPSFTVKFSRGSNQLISLIGIAFRLFVRTITEKREIEILISQHNIDLVISDNRYGLYARKIPSVLLTHQLSIQYPHPFKFLKPVGEMYVRIYAQRFTECWIPDSFGDFSLSGALTNPSRIPANVRRVGLMSRFYGMQINEDEKKWDLMAIVSGPPPHRDILEQEVEKLAQRLSLKAIILQGLPQFDERRIEKDNITLVANMLDKEIAETIAKSKYLLCRGGYCTIADLIALNRTAILVPTPGQTEQEYLADYLKPKNLFRFFKQNEIKNIDLTDLKATQGQLNIGEVNFFEIPLSYGQDD